MQEEADFRFFGLSLWIEGRQFPNASDGWDSNWLRVRAVMEDTGARVECTGPIMTIMDVEQFRSQLVTMERTLTGQASLEPLEPNLKVTIRMLDTCGHIEGIVDITPDHMSQRHRFEMGADQSYLQTLIASCDRILAQFPVKEADAPE